MISASLAAATFTLLMKHAPSPVPEEVPAATQSTSSATPAQLAQWQAELDAAQRTRSHGRALQLAGGAAVFTGVVLIREGILGSHGGAGRFYAGQVTALGGAVLLAAGDIKVRDAKIVTTWLNAHGPAPMSRVVWLAAQASAETKRTRGRLVEYAVGLPMLLSGALMLHSTISCHTEECGYGRFTAGMMTTLVGAVAGGVGWRIAHDAGITLDLLNRHPPGPAPTASSRAWTIQPSVGLAGDKHAAMFCRVTW